MPKEIDEQVDDILVELEEEEDQEGEDTIAASGGDEDEQGSSKDEADEKRKSRDRGAERRIAQLVAERNAAEDRVRAAEARLREAEEGTTRLTEEASYYLDRATASEEEALDSALDGVKSKLRKAHEEGDADMVAEATLQLTKLEASKREVARQKDAKTRYLADREKREKQAPQQNGATQQRQRIQPSEKATAWKEQNESWFGQDPVMTNTAFTIHNVMVNSEGYDPESDEYYEELDARLREYFPQKFKGNGAGKRTAQGGQAEQLVAGAARAPARGKSKSVKLTQSQLQVAKDLGLTPQQYARELLKMQQREQEA